MTFQVSITTLHKSLMILFIICLTSLLSCNGPCDGDCGSGTFCCPNPSGPGGTCCLNGQVCASTGGRFPGPMCENAPKEENKADDEKASEK